MKYQTVVQVTILIRNRRSELRKQQIKLIPTRFQSNVHYVGLWLDLATL